jgi:acyl-coenzyme A thioesterase PaaI-like protein
MPEKRFMDEDDEGRSRDTAEDDDDGIGTEVERCCGGCATAVADAAAAAAASAAALA